MNIIQIRQADISQADEAFREFMFRTECYLNEKTRKNKSLYKSCKGDDLELVAVNALHELAPSTPFRKEHIRLVSGASFPDIVAERYYGVEVKSTKGDSWKSTGSSIVESTRVEDVSRIYMLFGKLGGEIAQFKCLPYEDCLYDIAVTHSPRYLIDMKLRENGEKTIFDKMDVQYDSFRELKESEKINKVRSYYRDKAKADGKLQMPWWMGDNDSTRPVISVFSNLSEDEKRELRARMYILFGDEVLCSNYSRAAMWLCIRYSIVCANFRDLFSAGGKVGIQKFGGRIVSLDCKWKENQVPKVIGNLHSLRYEIVGLLKKPDVQLCQDVEENWSAVVSKKDYLDFWLNKVDEIFKKKEIKCTNIRELFADVLD